MKSIVLSERSLVQESEDLKNLKEEKINEESNEKEIGKKTVSRTAESKKSETQVQNLEEGGITVQNGDKWCSKKESFKKEISETIKSRCTSQEESINRRQNFLTNKIDTTAGIEINILCSVKKETDCFLEKNSSESVKNLDAENGSECVEDPEIKKVTKFVVENNENSEDAVEIIETEESGRSSQDRSDDSARKNFDADMVEEIKLIHAESKESVQPSESIVLDLDENKENVKREKEIGLNDFSGSDLPNKHSSGCEIQVGKVETISGKEKESMWADDELIKCDKNFTKKSKGRSGDECQDISMSTEDSMNVTDGDKEENQEFEIEENSEEEEEMNNKVEESNEMEEGKNDEKENEQTDLGNFQNTKNTTVSENKNIKTNLSKSEGSHCRKRQIFKNDDEDPSAKKKRLSKARKVQLKEKNLEDSSRSESLSSFDAVEPSSKGRLSNATKTPRSTKRTMTDNKTPKKLNSSVTKENASNAKRRTREEMFSILEKFRGTLKTLTRSDLEELIVQKLCEVITERSNVGELRQKAEALEQDQERWKTKAQSLTKQMREMEMVMKKYISEVQKQIKEGDTHVVTPLKVTRSVGLQVSFYSSTSKGQKPSLSPAVPTTPTPNTTRNAKNSSQKGSPQPNQISQNTRNKAASAQKVSSSVQKSPDYQQRRSIAPRPENSSNASNRAVAQQTSVSNNRGVQNQVQTPKLPGCKVVPGTSPQPQQSKQQKQQPSNHQKPQQNGSKIIDLTDDDDRQPGNKVKTAGTVFIENKVVSQVINHLPQSTASQNNTFAYLLPTTSPSAVSPVGQNRQVLIATPTMPQPNRPIMCSMPPLLFKGGNVVQTTQMLNQSNHVVLPKTYRHPAPLPKRPIYQNTRPSLKLIPPRPALKISKVQTGIVLSWNMSLSPEHAPIASYQLFAYQETESPPATSLWKKVGDVKALPLPMACTLTQFMTGHKYHFAVRAVDLHSRIGPFSFPGTIVLV